MKVIKRVLACIGAFFVTISTKVLAIGETQLITPAYGVIYPEPEILEKNINRIIINNILNICRLFIIPITLFVGIIIYLKKSKSSKKKKIIVTIGMIATSMILYFVINKIYILTK